MLERTMEELIAKYPNEFFTRHQLTLKGRQGIFPDVGRYDLLFIDEFGTQIVMELKAVTAKYEDATQLAKYRDALVQKGVSNVLMWLVAPIIPQSVRDFLDHVGIEYTEIHEPEFRKVAERHGHFLNEDEKSPRAISIPSLTKPSLKTNRTAHAGTSDWFLSTDEGEAPGVGAYRRMIANSCVALWGLPDRGDPAEKLSIPSPGERVFLYLNRVGIIASGIFTNEPPRPGNAIFGKESEQEFHRSISDVVTVDNARAVSASEVLNLTGYRLPSLRAFCKITDREAGQRILKELEIRSRQ